MEAPNPAVPQRCCHQQGCKNRANPEAHFSSSSFFAWLWFCQVVCAMIFPRGHCWGPWFLTFFFYCKVMIIARSRRRASNELHAVILFVCFDRVCLSSANVWDLFQHRKRLHLQILTSSCQRERSVFLLTDCFFLVKQQADTILFSLPLKKRLDSLILPKEH